MVASTRILGPDGQPISTADLTSPQTSHIAQLRNEFAAHPSRGLTPSKLASILDAAENGDLVAQCELYEDMEEKDAHIASEMGKRRRAVTLLDWDVVPPTSPYAAEKKAADRLKELLGEIDDFEGMLYDVTDAIGKGYANLELEWHRLDGNWLPKSVTHRPQSWFQLYRGYRQEIRLRDNSPFGAPLQPFGWISHEHKAKSGYLERAALFRVLVWPYLFKNYSVADLAEFLEIYGIPLRIGKYPPGASDKEKTTLLKALVNLGHNAAGIMPSGMEVDFQDAADGEPGAFQLMIDWCEKSCSKAILGGTLTSQADGKTSTNALGKIHDKVRNDVRDSDVRQIAATLTRDLIYPIAALNGLAVNLRRSPRFRFNTQEPEDLETYSTALPALVDMGMKIPRQWAQEKLGIPEPEADDTDVLKPAKVTAPPATGGVAANDPAAVAAAIAMLSVQTTLPADPPARMTDALDANLQPAMNAWLGQIRALVDKAGTLEEIRDGIATLAPDMSLDDYTAAMRQALAAAALAGRYEILREAGA
jgi:phage gp29-like protein